MAGELGQLNRRYRRHELQMPSPETEAAATEP